MPVSCLFPYPAMDPIWIRYGSPYGILIWDHDAPKGNLANDPLSHFSLTETNEKVSYIVY